MCKCHNCHKEIKTGDKVKIICMDCFSKITDLEAKLAEKGKEIKSKNDKLCELKQQLKDCQKALKRKTQSNRDLQHLKHNTNTEFAIEKLERVKEEMHRGLEFDYDLDMWATEFIDTIINEIKGE